MKFLLDTNIIVDYFRKKERAKEMLFAVASKGNLAMSLITYGELLYGTHRARNQEREMGKVDSFISDFNVEITPLNQVVITIYAKTKYLLERKGKKVDEFDLLIGATVVANGYIFVTSNIKHFARFPKLSFYS